MLVELKSIYLRTHQRLLRISGPCAQVKKECHKRQERICISRIASSIELSQDSWPKAGISPTSMELAENQFMEKSLQMKISPISTPVQVFFQWQMQGLELMDLNSSCAMKNSRILMESM